VRYTSIRGKSFHQGPHALGVSELQEKIKASDFIRQVEITIITYNQLHNKIYDAIFPMLV